MMLALWLTLMNFALSLPSFDRQLNELLQSASKAAGPLVSNGDAAVQFNGQSITFSLRDNGFNMSRYIVKLKDGTPDALIQSIQKVIASLGISIEHSFSSIFKGFSIYVSTPSLPVKQLSSIPFIDYIERDVPWEAQQVQSPTSWGLDRLDQPSNRLDGNFVFDATGKNVNVYVLDSGVDTDHSEFTGRAQSVYTAPSVEKSRDAKCLSHGTHVAGIVGGANVGVAKQANVHSLRVIRCDSNTANSEVIAAIQWVIDNHKKPAIINLSLGPKLGPDNQYVRSESLESAIEAAIRAGITVIAAAGNDNTDACSGSPAGVPGVITVGAADKTDTRARFATLGKGSNYGTCVSIFAPGVDIVSAAPDNGWDRKEGTSQATPFVSGIAALYLEKNPKASPAEVAKAIYNAAKPVVKDSRGSSVLMAQLTNIPERGSPGYNAQLVKLSPPDAIPFQSSDKKQIIEGIDNKYIFIGCGVTVLIVIFVVGLCFCKIKRSKKSDEAVKQQTTHENIIKNTDFDLPAPIVTPTRSKRLRENEDSFYIDHIG